MSTAVEDQVVQMKFDNKQFEPAAQQTMGTLDKLKQALNFGGASKGLNDLQDTASRFSLGPIGAAAQGVGGKFLAMSTIAITALANIVNRAVDTGVRVAKAFSLEPLTQGFQEYEANLGSTQTIMSGTGESVDKVTASLQRLNNYSDKTIYSFSDMTKNISMFTNAGLSSKKATDVMIGISNAAAAAGISADKAANAMFGFGQSMSVGHVQLQDWNQIDQAGIATKGFKEELIKAGLAAGTLKKSNDGTIKTNKGTEVSFKNLRNTLQDQWLTSDVLTNTLNKYSDASTDVGKKAAKNAQNVYKFTQLMDVTKESIGSGWSQTFQNLFGNLKEASGLFTAINVALNGPEGFISTNSAARNAMLQMWKDKGGREQFLKGLTNIFKFAVSIVKPIHAAFREIFPATTGKDLLAFTARFGAFTEKLKIGAGTADKIKRTFKGVFAIFDIGWQAVKALAGVLGDLFGVIGSHSGGFLEMTASAGDWLVKLDEAIKKGDSLNKFFKGLGSAIKNPKGALKDLGDALKNFFDSIGNLKGVDISKYFGRLRDRLEPLNKLASTVERSWGGIVDVFKKIGKFLQPAADAIGGAFKYIGDALGKAFQAGDFNSVYDALNTGLLTGIVVLINKFLKNGLKFDFGGAGGLAEKIKGTFGALTDTLKAMQAEIQAKTLMKIAAAVALLVASIAILSMIDSAKLTKALIGLGVAFSELLGAMAILSKIAGSAGIVAVPAIAGAMVALSVAILILSAAVKILSGLTWEELIKGLGSIAVMLGLLVGVSYLMDKNSGGMMRAGLAMVPLAAGMVILAAAVKILGSMSIGELAKGLSAMAIALGIIAGAIALMPKSMALQAVGLAILAGALVVIAGALKLMGSLSIGEMVKSLVMLAGSLAIIAGGLYLMTGALPGAAALIVAAGAFAVLAPALVIMGALSWEAIGKGLTVIAASLLIMAVGLTAMSAALPGAAALVVASAGLALLAPVLVVLGALSWGAIAKGLTAIAATFLILGVAGAVLTPVVPVILGLGLALLMLGGGIALIGVGAMGLAKAFAIMATAGNDGIKFLLDLLGLIPQAATKLAEGVTQFAISIASQTDKLVKALSSLIGSLLDAIIINVPKIGVAINKIIETLANVLVTNAPRLAATGVTLIAVLLGAIGGRIGLIVTLGASIIVKFLNGIANNMGRIVRAGTNVVISFMNAISKEVPRLADAGAKAIINLVNGLAKAIRDNSKAMRKAGYNLAGAIIDGMTGGLGSLAWKAVNAAWNMAKSVWNSAKAALGINSPSKEFAKLGMGTAEGMALGTNRYSYLAEDAAVGMAESVIGTVKDSMDGISDYIPDNLVFDPVITPVLDLTSVTKDASKLSGMLDQTPISASVSYKQAAGISKEQADNAANSDSGDEVGGNTYLEFTQVNNSPKTLPASELYRNTKSQLALAKEALNKR